MKLEDLLKLNPRPTRQDDEDESEKEEKEEMLVSDEEDEEYSIFLNGFDD